ncbi:MAG TPA: hypothetical protein VN969_28170 [Streptosporangiaceae bacterium]|jgi:hypothetical protein|nr:hypothetical protein [Streptosporangiaceae bacterium]
MRPRLVEIIDCDPAVGFEVEPDFRAVAGETTSPFKVRGALVTDLFADRCHSDRLGIQRAAINTNLRRRRSGDVLADLDTLDQRILTALGAGRQPDVSVPIPARPRTPSASRADGHTTSISEENTAVGEGSPDGSKGRSGGGA